MATEVLHAWVSDKYAGRFERAYGMDRPRFYYDDGFTGQLSLSIPREGIPAESTAPGKFLDGLLPELDNAREHMRQASGATSTGSWELLSAIGGDLPGGLVLHPEQDGPQQEEPFTRIAVDEVIATRIIDIKAGGTGLEASTGQKPRFSLAGAQSKFALAKAGGVNFWSDAATPSTHILKPESNDHTGLELIESATLELANRVGVAAPKAEQVTFGGQSTFQIERFDRASDDGVTLRVHAEDMVQVLGLKPSEKYLVDAQDIAGVLRNHTGSDELGYQFYRQYIFNSLIGNADAHGKNYSILHRDGRIELSPLYDAIPIGMFPGYDTELAMPVGAGSVAVLLTRNDWIESAELAQLDTDRVLEMVDEISAGILEHLAGTIGQVGHPRVTESALDSIRQTCESTVR